MADDVDDYCYQQESDEMLSRTQPLKLKQVGKKLVPESAAGVQVQQYGKPVGLDSIE